MKLTNYQRKELADKVTEFYAKKIGGEVGYFITPNERKNLSAFAMRLINLRDNTFSVDYVRAVYLRQMKNSNAMMCLCANLICRDILNCDIVL